MRKWFSKYQHLDSKGKVREGALIKIEWPGTGNGYADLHPWEEFGDLPLGKQLESLKLGHKTPLVNQTIYFSKVDAKARAEKVNLTTGIEKIKNNLLITDVKKINSDFLIEKIAQGFSTFKIKCGRDIAIEVQAIKLLSNYKETKIRLDFNSSISYDDFENFWAQIESYISHIEYLEDPISFNELKWHKLRKKFKVYSDHETKNVMANIVDNTRPEIDGIVMKPAKDEIEIILGLCLKWGLKATLTSYLDHPVGIMHALIVAKNLKLRHPNLFSDFGCMTFSEFHSENQQEFASQIKTQGPTILANSGYGIGFDDLLQKQNWISL